MHKRELTGATKWVFVLFTWVAILVTIFNVFRLHIAGELMIDRAFIALLAGLFLPLVFLIFPATQKAPRDKLPWYDLILASLSLLGPAFVFIFTEKIMQSLWPVRPPPIPFILGLITWALILEGVRRSSGWILALFVGVFSVYPLFAGYLPGLFVAKNYSLSRVVGFHFLSDLSIFGLPMQMFGNILLGFLIFGAALEVTGGGKFLLDIAQAIVGRVRGGPALVAVVASSFLASLSGSAVANVISTGTVTIPAMKKLGIEPHVAGAIETAASTGGILTPPVMGAAAFIMAALLQIPYFWVAIAAAIPMLIYYASLFTQVYFYAQRRQLPALPASEVPSILGTLKWGWFYLGSVVVLVYLLFYIRVEAWAPYYATVFLILCSLLRKETRPNIGTFFRFTKSAGEILTQLAPQLAGVGMIIGAMSLTGIAQSMGGTLITLAQGNLYLLLLMGALGALIMGLGLTVTPCYIFMAIIFAPALAGLGITPIAAHLFFLYWGMMSDLTPPVGPPIYVAAAIAETDAMRVGWYAMRLGLIRFIIPFLFVLNPALVASGTLLQIIESTLTAIIGTVLMAASMENYLFRIGRLNIVARISLLIAGLLLVFPSFVSEVIGGVIAAVTLLAYVLSRRSSSRGRQTVKQS